MDLKAEIMADPRNQSFTERGLEPIYMVGQDVRILIIGQAPGLKVEQTGVSFNDKSGDRLREWMGIDRDVFYESGLIGVLPMDFYYPGKAKTGDLPPRKFVAQEWHQRIMATMPKIDLILLLGGYSQKYYLDVKSSETLTSIVKRFADFGPKYFPLAHPSPLNNIWLAKNPWFEATVVPALQKRVATILAK
ncbi:uracil-DNA glycosylase family protein [Weissella cibaria]|uniref:uracil-DNA glycosylase family protein n=1 Tax=Weissella cibaria TaxID=137591 RepID=UPI00106E10F1|nr:uracil-DNA glycosylase family protein [Weissella cibaria]MBU7561507.1 uracil-DNA glycosylase family protein [Weissella cibaria]MBZ5941570.1 uracil-DNA glycosylase family protein [Weissella cibaria]MCB5826313.1 uracil-DNA glycosylase family protein [Weissella cibaria]MCB5857780.1 uracil-DNA glycosylase family protein [Weissella cibaria]MCB5860098.1 uracil-DNA glycosylase family protein [Weissella cibaria]